jgi:CRISPR-associated endoribonuclease Cas6
MRFSLTLRRCGPERTLPINYQYELSSWIYHALYEGDRDFATWLHEQGYQFKGKRFRLFCFSRLDLRPYQQQGDRLIMQGERAQLELGFALPESGQHFLTGLFAQQQFRLGDRRSQVAFEVESLELLPAPAFDQPAVTWQALSPICVSRPRPDSNNAAYLHPEEPDYVSRLYQNLMHKMQSYTLARGGLAMPIPAYQPEVFDLEVLSPPKSDLITLAAGTSRETEVRGFRYAFRLHCDPSWQAFLWQVGLGEKNSQGFGFVGAG